MKRIYFIIMCATLIFSFVSCNVGAVHTGDSEANSVRDADILMISEKLGLGLAEASEIWDILSETGLDGGIKYITMWNDPDGGAFYRIRTDGGSRDVYLYSDGSVRVCDGGEELYPANTEPSRAIVPDDTDAVPTDTAETDSVSVPETETDTLPGESTETSDEVISDDTEDNTETVTTDIDTETTRTPETETEKTVDKPDTPETFEVVLNTNTKKYHYPGCSSISQMKESNKKIVYVSSIEELLDMGYDPCGRCAKGDKR